MMVSGFVLVQQMLICSGTGLSTCKRQSKLGSDRYVTCQIERAKGRVMPQTGRDAGWAKQCYNLGDSGVIGQEGAPRFVSGVASTGVTKRDEGGYVTAVSEIGRAHV